MRENGTAGLFGRRLPVRKSTAECAGFRTVPIRQPPAMPLFRLPSAQRCVLSLETGYRHTARGYNLQVHGRVRTVGDENFPNRWHRVTNIGQCLKCCTKFGHSPRSGVPRSSFQGRQMFTFGRTRRRAPYNTAHIGAREQTSAAERRWEKVQKACTPDS